MKNVLIVDGAQNCAYDIFAATDEEFLLMFPVECQDIAFIDEILAEESRPALDQAFKRMWQRPVEKKTISGLHGTIFYELEFKKKYYPNRRDSDLTDNRSRAQR